jgi:hypothetical protein
MLRRMVIVSLAGSLLASPAFSQSLQESAQRSALALGAQQPTNQKSGGMSPAVLVSGVSMLIAGGLTFLAGTTACGKGRVGGGCTGGGLWMTGAALSGAGAAVLVIGKATRKRSPQIIAGPGGILVRSRISF